MNLFTLANKSIILKWDFCDDLNKLEKNSKFSL